MKKVTLFENIESSVIGFGCAPILGAVDSKTATKALELALELGINHFDLARSYGYGDAESLVGKILKPYRNNVIFSTKFGIKANYKAKLLKPVKPIVRKLIDLNKRKPTQKIELRAPSFNSVSDRFHNRIDLNVKEMNKSLNESLKALNTDYVDYFFIHEPFETILNIDNLLEEATKLKKEGKIRAFGIAYMQDKSMVHEAYLKEFDVLQYNNSPGIVGYDKLVNNRSNKPNIFFSPIKGGSQELTVSEKLEKLHKDFPKSVILCSMFKEKHLKANVVPFF